MRAHCPLSLSLTDLEHLSRNATGGWTSRIVSNGQIGDRTFPGWRDSRPYLLLSSLGRVALRFLNPQAPANVGEGLYSRFLGLNIRAF